jgi:outer membrane protease
LKYLLTALYCAAVCLAASPATGGEASPLTWKLGIEGGYLAGEASYHITVPTASSLLESRLVWPLDSSLVGIGGEAGRDGRWAVGFSVRTNASSAGGAMEDSDWIDRVKFIFSTSDVSSGDFSALLVSLQAARRLAAFDWGHVSAEGGYDYRYFDLTASDLDQFSPLGIAEFAAVVPGPVVTYKTFFSIPHAGVALTWAPEGRLSVTGRVHLGYAFVRDEDDHLLRFKLSKGETDGLAFLSGLEGTYALTRRFSISSGVEYLSLRTDGTQNQVFYDGPSLGLAFAGIPNEIDSEQVTVTVRLTARF